ncbi:MAG: glutamine--fructose-6-phosphate transaminase (isomerizing) [Polyangiales bacterium]
MCGIFGYAGERPEAASLILEGLKKLEYRGYDSWGIAVGDGVRAALDRRVGKIGDSVTELPASAFGLGHTRWATHGPVTDDNAHPQLDCSRRLALVHNGMLTNETELREALGRTGHRMRSHTDSELIAHLVEDLLGQTPQGNDRLVKATMAAFRKLRGLNAIAVLDTHTGQIAAAKSGTPLVLGQAPFGHFIASDHAALLDHTREVSFVRDGQAVLIDRQQLRLFDIESGSELIPELITVEWDAVSTDRKGHPDYMTKEIHEQPAVLRTLAERSIDRIEELAQRIKAAREVIMIGCGSAAHAALAAQHQFARIAMRRMTVASAYEFEHHLPFVDSQTLVIALSQSGETIDVLDAVRAARAKGAQIVALTNVEGSSLWRTADLTVPLHAGPERCVLATKSFSAKLALSWLTAHALADQLDTGRAALEHTATDLEDMLQGPRRAAISAIAGAIQSRAHLYVIGRGPSHPLALEVALKIKEVSYIHAEGFAGGELKHGVIALIEPHTPCIVLAPNDETRDDVIANALQVKARGAVLIGIASDYHPAFDHHIPIAAAGVTQLLQAVVAQLLGYDLAHLRGHDPDMPRNLAKSVTVK